MKGRIENKGLPLFYKLLITFSGVIIFICGMLTVAYYVFSKRSLEQHTQEYIVQQCEVIARHFSDEMRNGLVKDIHILASNPILDEFMMSSELDREINARKVERLFLQSIQYMENYQAISFVDYSGREKVRVGRSGRIKKYRDVRGSGLFTRIESGRPGTIHTEGPYRDKDGNVSFFIGIYKTDADIGKFGGAVIVDYALEDFLRHLDTIKIFGANAIWVFAPRGEVLKQPRNERFILDPRAYLSKGFQEVPVVAASNDGMVAYQDLSVLPGKAFIRLVISIPSSLLFEDIRSVLRFLSIVFLVSLFTIFLISYYLSGYLSKPIIELAHAATRLAKGELSTQVKVKTTGEVQMLVDSFNQMAQDLEKTTVSKEYVDNIFRSMIDTLIVVSPDGIIETVNSAACALLGYQEAELIGQPVKKIFADGMHDGGRVFDEFIKYGLMKNAEYTYLTKGNKKIPVLFSSSVIYSSDATPQGIVCVAVDITERKRTEEKLKSYAAEIEQANEDLKTFAYTVSHDLRAPLVNIRGFSEELKRTIQEGRPLVEKCMSALTEADRKTFSSLFEHDVAEALEFIGASVNRMDALIENILKLSRLGRSELKPEPVHTEELVHSLLKTLAHQIDSHKAKVTTGKLPDLFMDRTAAEQIFGNLLDNALKYLEPGRPGTIEVTAHENAEDIQFTIRDNGRGIAPEDTRRVFELFRRVGKQDVPGHGMGLTYVKTLIKRLGGRIWCESELGGGSTFSFTIPVKARTDESRAAS